MIDYLELLLPPDEEPEEDAPERTGLGRPVRGAGLTLEKEGAYAPEGPGSGTALEGAVGGSPEDRGLEPAEEPERVRAAWTRAQTERGAGPGLEYGEDAGERMVLPSPAAPGAELEVRAAALAAAAGRARQAASRPQAGETAEQGAGWSLRPERTVPDGEDPVRLVDAAFQRDARRYDAALGML